MTWLPGDVTMPGEAMAHPQARVGLPPQLLQPLATPPSRTPTPKTQQMLGPLHPHPKVSSGTLEDLISSFGEPPRGGIEGPPDPYLERRRVAAQVAAGIPELGWSISEALFVPLLLRLHVPHRFLTVCWLFSPVVGLVMHPIVGAQADIHGRRPFILLFGLVAALGLATMPICVSIHHGAALAIFAFGLADTGHDLIYTPSVAQMNDLFDPEDSEHRCAVLSGLGKLLGLIFATALHSEPAFWAVAAIIAGGSLLQLTVPKEQMDPGEATQMGCFGPVREISVPEGFYGVAALQFAGWMSVMIFSFYFTSAWAQENLAEPGTDEFTSAVQFATGLLTAGSLWFTAFGALLPKAVALFGGEEEILIVSLAAFAIFAVTFSNGLFTIFCAVFMFPAGYQVVARVPYTWVERQPGFEEADRGRLTGRLTLTLSGSQIIVALAGGPVVAMSGGKLVGAFHVSAAVNAVAVLLGLGVLRRARRRRALQGTAPRGAQEPLLAGEVIS